MKAETAEAVVVGGGVMGCALAYQLARQGVDVTLLERAALGGESTGKCAGGVRQQFSNEPNVRLSRLSVRLLAAFEEELGMPSGFRQVGYMFVLATSELVSAFRGQLAMWHRAGLTEARWLTPAEVGQMVPALSLEGVLGATFCPTDGLAGPADVTAGYAAGARRHGARLREGVRVTGIRVEAGRVTGVSTSAGEIASPVVFDCAGAWAGEIGRLAGVEVPVRPFRRHVFVTDRVPGVTRDTPMTVDIETSFYFHPEGDGVLAGMSDRGDASTFDQEVDWDFLERAFAVVARRAPALASAGLRTAWAGLYETTPDNQAILGPARGVEGFWCACGFSGHGFMQAPGAAVTLSQAILGRAPEVDLAPFSLDRFETGELVAELDVI